MNTCVLSEITSYINKSYMINIKENELITFINTLKIKKNITKDDIINTVYNHFGLDRSEMFNVCRKDIYKIPRHISIYFIRTLLNISTTSIGILFVKNHATMINSIKYVKNRIHTEPEFKNEIANIRAKILINY